MEVFVEPFIGTHLLWWLYVHPCGSSEFVDSYLCEKSCDVHQKLCYKIIALYQTK